MNRLTNRKVEPLNFTMGFSEESASQEEQALQPHGFASESDLANQIQGGRSQAYERAAFVTPRQHLSPNQ